MLRDDMAAKVQALVWEYTSTTVRGVRKPGGAPIRREGHVSADARLAAGGETLREGTLPGFCMDRIYAMLQFLWVALRDVRGKAPSEAAGCPFHVRQTDQFVKRLTPRAKHEMVTLAKACNGGRADRGQIEGSMCLSQHVRAFCGVALRHILQGPTEGRPTEGRRTGPKWNLQWAWAKDQWKPEQEVAVVEEVVQAMQRFQAQYDEEMVRQRCSP